MGWSMDQFHGVLEVVHGPGSMFCKGPSNATTFIFELKTLLQKLKSYN